MYFIKFTLESLNNTSTRMEFFPLEIQQIICRMDGFFPYCNWEDQFPNENLDNAQPYEADFAIYEAPLKTPHSTDVQNFPFLVYGIAPIINIPGIEQLVLTKETLAKIFRGCNNETSTECLPGSITSWGDPLIKATNPPTIYHVLYAAGDIILVLPTDATPTSNAFKRALSTFEEGFNLQIGPEEDSYWNGTQSMRQATSYGSLLTVANTENSISFEKIDLNIDQPGIVQVSLINANNVSVSPNRASLFSTVLEIGMAYGNDGTNPSLHELSLLGPLAEHSWPITMVGYLALRPTITPGKCFQRRTRMLEFFQYYYSDQGQTSTTIDIEGFAPIGQADANNILMLLQQSIECNGTIVYQPPPALPIVTLQVDDSLLQSLEYMANDFELTTPSQVIFQPLETYIELRDKYICSENLTCAQEVNAGGLLVVADENLSTDLQQDNLNSNNYDLLVMPYAAMALGFIHNFCDPQNIGACPYLYFTPLILDVNTVAEILDEKILFWNDTKIAQLNPDKANKLPNEMIRVIAGPKTSSIHMSFVETVRRTYDPSFAYVGGGEGSLTYKQAWIDVSITPYSISLVVFNGTIVDGVQAVSILSRQNVPVAANPINIEACAKDTYDSITGLFNLNESNEPNCYPLLRVYNLFFGSRTLDHVGPKLAQYMYNKAIRTRNADGTINDATILNVDELGTLVDVSSKSLNLVYANQLLLETITDLLTGRSILLQPQNLNLIPSSVITFMYSLLAFELFLFLALAIWVVYYRHRKLIRNSSPIFMLQVLFGAAIMACTTIPLAQQDDYLISGESTVADISIPNPFLNAACASQPILFSLGFFITFSALFLKSWRLIRIFNNKKLKNLFLHDRQLLVYQLIVITVVVVLNLIWVLQTPLVWQRFPVTFDSSTGLVTSSIGICYSTVGIYPALPLMIGVLLVLIIGNYLAYLGRRIPTEFNESRWTAMAMVMTLEAFVIGLPILILANDEPVPGFIIKAICSILVSGATVCLIFAPKVALAYGWGFIPGESNPWRFVKGSSSQDGSKNNGKPDSHSNKLGVANSNDANVIASINRVKSNNANAPSLTSLIESKASIIHHEPKKPHTKVGVQTSNPAFQSSSALNLRGSQNDGTSPRVVSTKFGTASEALTKILQDDPMRRRFRRYLQTLKMEENVRFWDSIIILSTELDDYKRYVSARAIIQTFVLDSSPLQVNLSSKTRDPILKAFKEDNRAELSSITFFQQATQELFEDLRQSDAFRVFLENDTFSQQDAFGGGSGNNPYNHSKSDPVVAELVVGNPDIH